MPDCAAVLCEAPMVIVNLIDDITKENIIIKNNTTKESIIIQNTSQNLVEFRINETNGYLYANRNNSEDTFEIKIDSKPTATISYKTAHPKTNECCDFGELVDVAVDNKSFEIEGNKITIYLK